MSDPYVTPPIDPNLDAYLSQEFNNLYNYLVSDMLSVQQNVLLYTNNALTETKNVIQNNLNNIFTSNHQFSREIMDSVSYVNTLISGNYARVQTGLDMVSDSLLRVQRSLDGIESGITSDVKYHINGMVENMTSIIQDAIYRADIDISGISGELAVDNQEQTDILKNVILGSQLQIESDISGLRSATNRGLQETSEGLVDEIRITAAAIESTKQELVSEIQSSGNADVTALMTVWNVVREFLENNFTPTIENLTELYTMQYRAQSTANQIVQGEIGR